jgi:hypothetical protein
MNVAPVLVPTLLLCACGAESQAQRNDNSGSYMSVNSRGEPSGMRMDGERVFGPNFDLIVTPTGYQGTLQGALTMMSSDDGRHLTGTRDGRPIDMHLDFDGVTVRATGMFAGRLSRLQIDAVAITSSVGRCGFDLKRQDGLHYSGQRACTDGVIAPADLELPAAFVRLPMHRQVMLLAALFYV